MTMQAPQLLGPGIVYMPAPPPRQSLEGDFASVLAPWKKKDGVDKVRDAIAACGAALAKLGKRTGERADAARDYLEQRAAACRAALAAFDAIGVDCDGPMAQALIDRIAAHRAASRDAQAAMASATRETIRTARDELDMSEASGNELSRDIQAARAAMKYPALPDVAALDRAESETVEITTGGNAKHKPATTLGRAIEQGASAPKGVALLWIAFEPAGESEACSWRWRRYLENR